DAHDGTPYATWALTVQTASFCTEHPNRHRWRCALHLYCAERKGTRMHPYSSLCDDFYVNINLSTEMDLPASRETILHFFERLQKEYPTMRNFYCREKGDFILEEDKESG